MHADVNHSPAADHAGARRRRGCGGFTAIELLIVAVCVAILAMAAYPSYKRWIDAGRRADGTTTLLDLANRMQRYYADNNTFATATIANIGGSTTSQQGYYTLSISAQTATTYTLLATRAGAQTGDTLCGDLTLTSASVRGRTGSAPTVAECWR